MLGDISCISYSKNPRVNKSDVMCARPAALSNKLLDITYDSLANFRCIICRISILFYRYLAVYLITLFIFIFNNYLVIFLQTRWYFDRAQLLGPTCLNKVFVD